MPKLGTEVRESTDIVKLHVPYEITFVDVKSTEVRGFSGIFVDLLSKDAVEGHVAIWHRPVTSPTSKEGAFITALGDDTDKWLHKWIIFKEWQEKKRVIEVKK